MLAQLAAVDLCPSLYRTPRSWQQCIRRTINQARSGRPVGPLDCVALWGPNPLGWKRVSGRPLGYNLCPQMEVLWGPTARPHRHCPCKRGKQFLPSPISFQSFHSAPRWSRGTTVLCTVCHWWKGLCAARDRRLKAIRHTRNMDSHRALKQAYDVRFPWLSSVHRFHIILFGGNLTNKRYIHTSPYRTIK